jgi:hypothetical protein
MFYVPAPRVMALRDGLTRTFLDFRAGDPYVVRVFSDKLHRLVQTEFAQAEKLFPQANRLNSHLRQLIDEAFFRGFSLELSRESSFQKRLVLKHESAASARSSSKGYVQPRRLSKTLVQSASSARAFYT